MTLPRDERFLAVRSSELDLLTGAARREPDRLREILDHDFIEIGRSGRRWTKDQTIAAVTTEQQRSTPDTDEWHFIELSPTLILASYRVVTVLGISRHSSLWDVSGAAPVLKFHQGTNVDSEEARKV